MTRRMIPNDALAFLPLAIMAAATSAQAQGDQPNYRMGDIKVGDAVSMNAEVSNNNKWYNCTVTAVKPDSVDRSLMDNMTLRCEGGRIYQPMANPRLVRKGGAGAEAGANMTAAQVRMFAAAAPTGGSSVQALARRAIEHYYGSQTVEWHNLQIGAPRTISPRDAVPLEIRGGTTVYPALATISTNSAGTIRDRVQTFYIYKDDFGNWVAAPYASGAVSVQVRGEYGH